MTVLEELLESDTSDLIDAGIDVELPYEGSAPDLGPYYEKKANTR